MRSSKIPFISRSQSHFQERFFSEYLRYGILCCCFVFFFFQWIITNSFSFFKSLLLWRVDYAVWQQIELPWIMSKVRPDWLVWFDDKRWNYRFLKSSDLDLSRYKWELVVAWTISDTAVDGNYTILVDTIYQTLQSSGNNLNTKYINISQWLYIEVNDPNYFIDLDKLNNVIIKDLRTFRPALKIESFLCDRKQENKNCGQLIRESDTKKRFDSFISSNSTKFYKINDSTWFTDDKQWKWYHITSINDASLYHLSEFITIINKDWIAWKIYDRLSTLCHNEEFTMTQAENLEVRQANGNWFAIIKGKSTKSEDIQCEIYLDDSTKQWIKFELVNILPL